MGITENDRFYRKNITDYPEYIGDEKHNTESNPRIMLL